MPLKIPAVKLPSMPKLPPTRLALPTISVPGLRPASPPSPVEEDPTIEDVVDGIRTSFMERAKEEQARVELVTDTEYWACLCFESRAQKDAFLKALGLWSIGDKYINGIQAAKVLGVDLGAGVRWPKTKGLSDRLRKHVDDEG